MTFEETLKTNPILQEAFDTAFGKAVFPRDAFYRFAELWYEAGQLDAKTEAMGLIFEKYAEGK